MRTARIGPFDGFPRMGEEEPISSVAGAEGGGLVCCTIQTNQSGFRRFRQICRSRQSCVRTGSPADEAAGQEVWSPRVRGWSHRAEVPGSQGRVVPARAGMVPGLSCPGGGRPRGPRACGDGPGGGRTGANAWEWSPRVRGWSLALEFLQDVAAVVPARAGMVPPSTPSSFSPWRGPRACGDGPNSDDSTTKKTAWSPRVRGWSHHLLGVVDPVPVVPARAGMVPGNGCAGSGPPRGPRACGDGPWAIHCGCSAHSWSPRVRGWSRSGPAPAGRGRVVPARAGMVPTNGWWRAGCRGGPRACGDGPPRLSPLGPAHLWSPRVRGWSLHRLGVDLGPGVVPARAGMVPTLRSTAPSSASGPRACGDGPGGRGSSGSRLMWSPRVRGWSRQRDLGRVRVAETPIGASAEPEMLGASLAALLPTRFLTRSGSAPASRYALSHVRPRLRASRR